MMNSEIKRIANSYAEEFCSDAIYPSHLFKAVLHKDMGLVHFLETELDKDYFYLQDWADIQMQLSPRATRPSSDLELSDEGQAVMDEAFSYQEKFGMSSCEPICVLASLVTPGVGFTFDQLKTLPLNATEICNKIGIKTSADGTVVASATTPTAKSVTGKGVVQQYCINKIEEVQAGKIAPVVGFENEISTIFEILGRKTKSNLLITGESGVGKTSLINGFATQLAQGRMPSFLNNAKLYELDLAALSADASYKGEIEDRFKKVLAEIRETENAILVIESIDKLFDKQGSLYGAATMLKQELGKGNLLLLCTSSIDGYTKNIETDKEFVTKLEKISLEEPNADLCLRILKGALPTYENFHHLSIAEPVMADAIRLAKRYLTEKALPDSAFDLIDHTMALLKTMNDMSATDLASMEEKLNSLQSADPKMTEEEQMKELEWLNYEMLHKTSCILLAQLDTDTDFSKLPTVEKRVSYLQKSLQQLAGLAAEKRTSVESADLYAVVAKQTGIPLGKVQSKERDRLVNAEGTLKKRVVGQDHAVKIVLDAVFESRSGLNKKGQPMGSFFFLGPTGTGKTELSKALAAFLFEDESALIRFDMSEFKEEHSVALLYGAPPGYVGYEEGGLLVNKIRQKPYSVVLFDEMEKAHPDVFNILLQILDDGRVTDSQGRTVDFKNTILIMTSNLGSSEILDGISESGTLSEEARKSVQAILRRTFKPEFLNRIDDTVIFTPLSRDQVRSIVNLLLNHLRERLAERQVKLTVTDAAIDLLMEQGYDPIYGARPMKRLIQSKLETLCARAIVAGQVHDGQLTVDAENGEFVMKE